MTTIDLGSKPLSDSAIKPANPSKVYYPSFHVSGADDLSDLPSGEFTATITGKVSSVTKSTRDGKTVWSCEIEVRDITPDGSGKDSGDGLNDAIDKIAKKKSTDAYEEDSEAPETNQEEMDE